MRNRVLVMKAGAAANNNLIRALRSGKRSWHVVGCNDDRFVLKRSIADRNYLVPNASDQAFFGAICHVIRTERIDIVIPNTDADVMTVARLQGKLPCKVFLPRQSVIERCLDKYELTQYLDSRGLPVPATELVAQLDKIGGIFRRLNVKSPGQLWCRIRQGAGSIGAIGVTNQRQARAWIQYWQEMRGIPVPLFTLSEYLPGRDYCVQCLFDKGRLIMAKMYERLSYHVAGSSPSGVSSTSALAKIVFEPTILDISRRAILALDSKVSGAFFVDLKENAHGQACITEVNAGRFANVPTIHDAHVPENLAYACVRLALGYKVRPTMPCPLVKASYVMRGLDILPDVFGPDDLIDEIIDVRHKSYSQ